MYSASLTMSFSFVLGLHVLSCLIKIRPYLYFYISFYLLILHFFFHANVIITPRDQIQCSSQILNGIHFSCPLNGPLSVSSPLLPSLFSSHLFSFCLLSPSLSFTPPLLPFKKPFLKKVF